MDMRFPRTFVDLVPCGQTDLILQSLQGKACTVGLGSLEIDCDVMGIQEALSHTTWTVRVTLAGTQPKQQEHKSQHAAEKEPFVLRQAQHQWKIPKVSGVLSARPELVEACPERSRRG